MAAKRTAPHAAILDAAMMAAGPREGFAALEGSVGVGRTSAFPSGTINPAPYASTYRGVPVPDHIADALNRLSCR